MWKRGQNTTSNDGSPTAKARPVNLVMHSPCDEDISSPSLGSLVNPENYDGRKRVGQAPRNWMLGDSKLEVGYSQVSRQEKVLQATRTRKLGQKDQAQTKSDENPRAQGNLLHPHQSSETWNTRTIDTWVRSFSIWRRSWECLQPTQHSQWTHTKPMF